MHVGTDILEIVLEDVLMSTLQSKSTSRGSDTEIHGRNLVESVFATLDATAVYHGDTPSNQFIMVIHLP